MKVSFDFDGTLGDRKSVQRFAKKLIEEGVEVWIVTTRYDQRCETMNPNYFRLYAPQCWEEVFNMADSLGIKREHIVFTCYDWKEKYFKNNQDFVFHLDDNIMEKSEHIPFLVLLDTNGKWNHKCKELMKKDFEGL